MNWPSAGGDVDQNATRRPSRRATFAHSRLRKQPRTSQESATTTLERKVDEPRNLSALLTREKSSVSSNSLQNTSRERARGSAGSPMDATGRRHVLRSQRLALAVAFATARLLNEPSEPEDVTRLELPFLGLVPSSAATTLPASCTCSRFRGVVPRLRPY